MAFWQKHTTPAPAPTPTISRNVHLQSYLNHHVLKPSTRKVSSDGTTYDTVFQTTNGFALILRVYLPQDNNRAPSMTLHGVRASHNWLDIRMKVIGYPPISSDQQWKASKLKLGDAVYAVIHHFQLTPPQVMEITDANLRRLQQSLSGSTSSNNSSNSRQAQSTSSHNNKPPPNYEQVANDEVNTLIPPIPSSFPEIDKMSLSEVKQVVDDEKVLERFVENTAAVKTLRELKQSIEASNVDVAKSNLLDHEEIVKEVCTEVGSLQQELDKKIEQYKKLDAERLELTHPPDKQEAIKELNKAKKDAYRESEEMAEEWVESGEGGNVSDFVKRFMDVRVLYHTRAAKAERLEMSM